MMEGKKKTMEYNKFHDRMTEHIRGIIVFRKEAELADKSVEKLKKCWKSKLTGGSVICFPR